jgi:hypothetical protein
LAELRWDAAVAATRGQVLTYNNALIDAPPAAAITPPPVLAEAAEAPANEGDDLTRIKGLGPKISTALKARQLRLSRRREFLGALLRQWRADPGGFVFPPAERKPERAA